MWKIYKATCSISGLSYVGQTKNTVSRRWTAHVRLAQYSDQFLLQKAIRKYGSEPWVVEIIDQCDSAEQANKLEIHYIQKFNTYKHGYNMTIGGHHTMPETVQKVWASRDQGLKTTILSKMKKGFDLYLANNDHGEKVRIGALTRSSEDEALRRAKISHARMLAYDVVSPDGTKYQTNNLKQFCEEHGLSIQMMQKSDRKGSTHKGWSCSKMER